MYIKINQLDRKPEHNEVITAHWVAEKIDGDPSDESAALFIAHAYGADSFQPDPESPDFIPYDQLTEADVIGWLMAKEGWAEALEARLDADIENQKNPPVLHGVPWSASDEV